VQVNDEAPEMNRPHLVPVCKPARAQKFSALAQISGVASDSGGRYAAGVTQLCEKGVNGAVQVTPRSRCCHIEGQGYDGAKAAAGGGGGGGEKKDVEVSGVEKIEIAIILGALFSLWPWIAGFHAAWYRGWLVAMLAALVWVTVRRVGRFREAAEAAKKGR
jgi:hypothetical protein